MSENCRVTVEGTVFNIGDVETYGESFYKRVLTVKVPDAKDSKWDKFVPIEFVKERSKVLDDLAEGQDVKLEVEIGGRWNDKHGKAFPDIKGWKVEAGAQSAAPVSADGGSLDEESSETLPF
tara:strand:- start:76 stop:441 length:366 start_codon:yes stop_codon:yes gene_type:complete